MRLGAFRIWPFRVTVELCTPAREWRVPGTGIVVRQEDDGSYSHAHLYDQGPDMGPRWAMDTGGACIEDGVLYLGKRNSTRFPKDQGNAGRQLKCLPVWRRTRSVVECWGDTIYGPAVPSELVTELL